MALKEKITADLQQSIRSGDARRRETLRMLIAAIHNTEIAQRKPLEDGDILGVVAREVKQRNDSIAEFSKGNRPDLVAKEEAERSILQEYLPEQMSRDEVEAEAQKIIDEVQARGPADKGKVMKQLMPRLKGKADGQVINAVVSELLSGKVA